MQGKDNSDKFGYFMHSELVQATLEQNKMLQSLHLEVSLAVPLTRRSAPSSALPNSSLKELTLLVRISLFSLKDESLNDKAGMRIGQERRICQILSGIVEE